MGLRFPVRARVIEILLFAAWTAGGALPAFASEMHEFNVPAEDAPIAIRDFASQADVQILAAGESVKDKHLHAVSGQFSTDQGLRLLLADSGLTPQYVGERSIALVANAKEPAATDVQAEDTAKEEKKSSSDNFLLAQVDQGQTSSPSTVEKQGQQPAKKKPVLEEVVVTGSRIPTAGTQGAQDVKIYTRQQIDQSGQTTVADFLSTLPDVSVATPEYSINTVFTTTTVRLHGLPIGTTLVLLNGRRVESSGSAEGGGSLAYFDLNNIPLSAVDRIEVISEGSSAVYGSDAIGGVVNVILKSAFKGIEANTSYGSASGTDERNSSLAWGNVWNKGSLSIIGSVQTRSSLFGYERPLTADQNFTAFGGPDNQSPAGCTPGNVFTLDGGTLAGAPPGSNASFAAIAPSATGNPRQTGFNGTYGKLNECSLVSTSSIIPATQREGVFAQGNYQVSPSIQLFTEQLFSHVRQLPYAGEPFLYGLPALPYAEFTVPASNPYNPFGETVGIAEGLSGFNVEEPLDTVYVRSLIGAKGTLFNSWYWEVAAWDSQDRSTERATNQLNSVAVQSALDSTNPVTALNPFIAGTQGSPQLLQSLLYTQSATFTGKKLAASGFLRGPAIQLPTGPLEVVFGSEYNRDELYSDQINDPFLPANTRTTNYQRSYAVFGEARIPILGNPPAGQQTGNTLTATIADRYDHYDDFGGKATPQYGLEWRPSETVLIRSTYGQAFKAPSLADLYGPQAVIPYEINDPKQGGQPFLVNVSEGGNPFLQPETGKSYTFGIVYTSRLIQGLQLALTQWNVRESDSIQFLPPQTIVDNENLFPDRVIRNPNGIITQINATDLNFGEIAVGGLDYQINYQLQTKFGRFVSALNVTNTYHYSIALTPGSPQIDATSNAQDSGNWAPRWKGTASTGWSYGPYTANLSARYVGRYRDYDPTPGGAYLTLGNFWLFDVNVRFAIGQTIASNSQWLSDTYVEVGGVNVLNRLPQFSNYLTGIVGYDPAEADMRGRFLYLKVGIKL